jgi:ribonuclease III
MSDKSKLPQLEKTLKYHFKDLEKLELALTHKSFGNEHRANSRVAVRDNERLEFLGDAILDFIISQMLLDTYTELSEGDLSKLRAGLVNEKTLSKIAQDLSLGEHLWLGKGEELTGGREKESILASTFEAIVAAVFADGGYEAADAWVKLLFDSRIKNAVADDNLQDHKTKLQEIVQYKFKTAPKYEVLQSRGPDHDKIFEVALSIQGVALSKAIGKSKKEAEQSAAKVVFEEYGFHCERLTAAALDQKRKL